jgi:hypothetical protein
MAPGATRLPAFYVVHQGGIYKILTNGDSLGQVGQLVLDLLEKKDIKAAQWWLDKVVKDITPDEDGTGFPAVRGLWSGITPETRGPNAMTLAAASLIGRYLGSSKALQILGDARPKALTSLEKSQIDKALCETLMKASKWDELLVVGKQLASSKMFSEEGFRYTLKAASGAKKWKELEAVAKARLEIVPTNSAAIRAIAIAKVHQGDRVGADEWIKRMTESSIAGQDERIFAAWNAMLAGKADQELLATLKKGNESGNGHLNPNYQYTLTTLQVVLQMTDDAFQSLKLAVDQEDYSSLDSRAWAVYGKICEQYGFPEEATVALGRARSQTVHEEMADWTVSLFAGKPH